GGVADGGARAGQGGALLALGAARPGGGPTGHGDTLWRVYSMTKPITSVVAMTLWEEGRLELTDEVSRYIPKFANVRVFDKGSALRPFLVPVTEPVRIWHLLTHTAGLAYGLMHAGPLH